MLDKNWRKEFAKPEPVALHLIKEQLELAYKQGSVKRVLACAKFLLKHDACEDELLLKLAEAGQKTNQLHASEQAFSELVKRYPENAEYVTYLVEHLYRRGRFSEALDLVELAHSDHPEFESTISELQQKQQLKEELSAVSTELLATLSSTQQKDSVTQLTQCIDLAIGIQDLEFTVALLCELVARVRVDTVWLLERFYWVAEHGVNYDYLQIIYALKPEHDWRDFLLSYLQWSTDSRNPSGRADKLLELNSHFLSINENVEDVCLNVCLFTLSKKWKTAWDLIQQHQPIDWMGFTMKYIAEVAVQCLSPEELEKFLSQFPIHSRLAHWGVASALEEVPEMLQLRVQHLQKALELEPTNPALLNDLGDSFYRQKKYASAKDYFFKAYQNDPDGNFYTCYNLALTLKLLGANQQSFEYFKLALSLEPEKWVVWKSIGTFMSESHANLLAKACFRLFLSEFESDADAWLKLAQTYQIDHQVEQTIQYLEEAERLSPNDFSLCFAKAGVETLLGHAQAAREIYEPIIDSPELSPVGRRNALTNMLFNSNYDPELSEEGLFKQYGWVKRLLPEQLYFKWHDPKKHRKVRVGYVSSDFKNHACAFFLEPFLSQHDHSRFELYAYSGVNIEDELTDKFKAMFEHWHYMTRMSDDELAELIRQDEIDILVDLSGHTGGHRLSVFALKPAPIQMSWLGYGYTTGLPQVDYFLCDWQMVPEGYEHLFAETPLRLPRTQFSYLPAKRYRDYQPQFKLKSAEEPILIGSATRAIRINDALLATWAEIMRRLPDAHFRLDNPSFLDPYAQEKMKQRLAQAGFPLERVWIGRKPDYFESLSEIDICLDCFPHNSGTTIFDMLWCGTPVVTKRDRPSVGRIGVSIIHGFGADDWIADTEQEYIDIVVKLASDKAKLFEIKNGMRERFLNSELVDGKDFCQKVEAAYLQVLEEYPS